MINSVRNTVLSVINKNNYGYITPADFNLFAKQAQMEIYEEYYSSYNKTINMENARMSGTEYADIEQPIAETLESFLVTSNLDNYSANQWLAPSEDTTGSAAYMILRIDCLNDTGSRIGTAEKVSNARIMMLSDSNLTGPSLMYPVYTYEQNTVGTSTIVLYPDTISDANDYDIRCTYFTYPKDPKWTYITLINGEPMFDQSQPDYQDFQLPAEDEYKLAMKILQYSGISIREQEVAAYALGQEQHEQPTFSQQQ
jgi:hypothetical protein